MTKISVSHQVVSTGFSPSQTHHSLKLNGSSELSRIHCDDLESSGNLELQNSDVGKLTVSGNCDLRCCANTDKVIASGRFFASDCPKLGSVTSAGQSHFSNCPDVEQITAAGVLSMQNTTVHGEVVYAGSDVTISQSRLENSLTCSALKVCIQDSSVGKLIIKPLTNSSSGFEFFGFPVFSRTKNQPVAQTIELIGKNCRVQSIVVEQGAVGKVILKNGAEIAGHPGSREIQFSDL